MATFAEVMETVIGPISVLFRAEVSAETEERGYHKMVDEYVNFLKPYDVKQLALAMDHIRRTYKLRAWPKLAHILDAIRDVAKESPPPCLAIAGEKRNSRDWSEMVLRSVWAERAMAVKGLAELELWSKAHPGEWPTDALIETFQANAKNHDRLMSRLQGEGGINPMQSALISVGKLMQNRELVLAGRVTRDALARAG